MTKIKKTKVGWYERNLEKLAERLWCELEKHFETHPTFTYEIDHKKAIPTKFGYKIKMAREIFRCEKEPIKIKCPLKWGFDGDEFAMVNVNDFNLENAERIVANKQKMRKISEETIRSFDSYIKRIILKLQLEGVTGLLDRKPVKEDESWSRSIGFWPSVEDECASTEKDHSVDYIIYYPSFYVFK